MEQPTGTDTTRDRMLGAAEELLRRHGPDKLNVVDIARALGMSHANIYRHFASKSALREAVVARWLHAITAPLEALAAGPGPAAERLEAWVLALAAAKHRKVTEDPEMFAAYHRLAEAHQGVVEAHLAVLRAQVARILADGAAEGAFHLADPARAAEAVMAATLAFHHPEHIRLYPDMAAATAAARPVLALLLAGLRAGAV